MRVSWGNIWAGDATLTLDDNAGSSSFVVQDSDKTNQFKVNSDGQGYFAGNVGIGTTSPGYQLHLSKYNPRFRITDTASGGGDWMLEGDDNYGGRLFFSESSMSLSKPLLTMHKDGNVGIGITSPLALLDLEGSGTPLLRLKGNANSVTPVFRLTSPSDGYAEISYTPSPTVASRKLNFAVNNDTIRMVVDGNGNVGIGTNSPSEKLEVSGNIKASGTISQGSSKEFKKNISSVSTRDAMKALNKLNPVRFEYKTDNSGEKHLGFIAEDVPELVAEKDRKHLNSMDITAVLTKVVQEQQRMLQEQQKQIQHLRNEVSGLKKSKNS